MVGVRSVMQSKSLILLAVALGAAPGCYFYYPNLPKTPPPHKEGERVEVKTESNSYERACQSYDRGKDCHVSSEGFTKTDSYTKYQATYGGEPLSQHELRQLVDPQFDKKLASIKSDKALCNVSLVPSVIAVAGLAALMIAGPFYDKLGSAAIPVAVGASGAALGGTLLSYPLGGFACKRAGRKYKAMFPGIDPGERDEVMLEDGAGAYVAEMAELAEAFNAKFAVTKTPPTTEEPTASPEPEESVAPEPTPAAADLPYKVGDKVMVDWKGSPYKATILAVEAGGRFKIHYDGYASSWDESVPAARIVGRR